jgi:hypothetical protein
MKRGFGFLRFEVLIVLFQKIEYSGMLCHGVGGVGLDILKEHRALIFRVMQSSRLELDSINQSFSPCCTPLHCKGYIYNAGTVHPRTGH